MAVTWEGSYLHRLMVHHVCVSCETYLPGWNGVRPRPGVRRRAASTVMAAISPASDTTAKMLW